MAHHLGLGGDRGGTQLAKLDAVRLIQRAQFLERAVDVDRRIMPARAQFGDHALRLAERVRADENAARRIGVERGGQLVDLVAGLGMAEDGQSKRRLGDEHVAFDRLKTSAGRVGAALVIARHDDSLATIFEQDLRRAEHVPGGNEGRFDIAEGVAVAIGDGVAGLRPIARVHDRERLGRRPHRVVPATRMIGMAVRHERDGGGARRVDPHVGGLHVDSVRVGIDPVAELCHHGYMGGTRLSSKSPFPRG